MRSHGNDPAQAGGLIGTEFFVGEGDGVVEVVVAVNVDVAEGVVVQDGTEVGVVAVVNVVGDLGGADGFGSGNGVETVYKSFFQIVIVHEL